MGLADFLGLKKRKTRKVSTKRKVTDRRQIRRKAAARAAEMGKEEPIITVSRQLTLIQEDLKNLDVLMHSGFKGLRDDHHKILEEQFSKNDLEEFKKELESRKLRLEKLRGEIEEKIELLAIDKRILDMLETENLQSIEVAKRLGIARQYAATRLGKLEKLGYVKKIKKGRNVYYKLVR